jgi:hypothetical protein
MNIGTDSTVVSVLYLTCPDFATVFGAAMGYLFVVEFLATAIIVTICVTLTGGSCRSAWDQTRGVLRAEMQTEEAEAQALLEEDNQLTMRP